MIERRRADRMMVSFNITKHHEGQAHTCRAMEISPTGIRLQHSPEAETGIDIVNIEVPLVEGRLTTSIPARLVWKGSACEAFAFEGASFAQQAMLERLFGNF